MHWLSREQKSHRGVMEDLWMTLSLMAKKFLNPYEFEFLEQMAAVGGHLLIQFCLPVIGG
jgi:hypothetical protein